MKRYIDFCHFEKRAIARLDFTMYTLIHPPNALCMRFYTPYHIPAVPLNPDKPLKNDSRNDLTF